MDKYILWLPGWYPNTIAPFDGDFIQRHAQAASILSKIIVVFVKKDEAGIVTNDVKTIINVSGNLTEIIVYYHPLKTGITFLDRLLSYMKFKQAFRENVKSILSEYGKPDLLHIHVAVKILHESLRLKQLLKIPLIISEHWTAFLDEAKPNLSDQNIFENNLRRQLFAQASAVTAVSKVLGEAIINKTGIKNYRVIPNVVNTEIFFPIEKKSAAITKFIHVSLLNYQKNFEGIIDALEIVKEKGHQFLLIVYGKPAQNIIETVKQKKLENEIIFKDEVPQSVLVKDVQNADAMLLYSHYETFGCVVIEANACGIPAILSDLPVFREYIEENKTGIFAPANDPAVLAEKIMDFIRHRSQFDQAEIASITKQKFSYTIVAKQFQQLYKDICPNDLLK